MIGYYAWLDRPLTGLLEREVMSVQKAGFKEGRCRVFTSGNERYTVDFFEISFFFG